MAINLTHIQILTAKICHDLAGAMGAVTNGVEYMETPNAEMRSKALELIKTSSEMSISKLIFLRTAFGMSKNQGEANLEELRQIIANYFNYSKTIIDFHEKYLHQKEVYISVDVGRIILCLAYHAFQSLIQGGSVVVKINKVKNGEIKITALGNNIKIDNNKNEVLKGNLADHLIDTNNIYAFYTSEIIKAANLNLEISNDEKYLEYKLIMDK